MKEETHHFYGKAILPAREEAYIESILKKYRHENANEALKKKIWDELQNEKQLGNISIPFKVMLRGDATGKYPPRIEVILDTKV